MGLIGDNSRIRTEVVDQSSKLDARRQDVQKDKGGLQLSPSKCSSFVPPRMKNTVPSLMEFLDKSVPTLETRGRSGALSAPLPQPRPRSASVRRDTRPEALQSGNQAARVQPRTVGGQRELPNFPAAASPDEKLAFTMKLLKDFPNATRAELEAKYTYTNPDNPTAKSGPLKFAGGGQGNVIFVQDTPFVVKQHLAGPEAGTYKFLNSLKQFLDRESMELNDLPQGLEKYSQQQLRGMYQNRDAIRSAFPVPIRMSAEGGNVVVAMKNVGYNENGPIGGSIEDVKIGSRIVSRNELKAHGDKKHKGFKWFMKKVTTRYLPKLKGTPGRGYEYISQSTAKGVGLLKARIADGRNSESIMRSKCLAMTYPQLQSFVAQLQQVKTAHESMPVTFVGASAMIALPNPNDRTSMPNVCMGDFAHAMTTAETLDSEGGNPLPSGTYHKYNANFDNGVGALLAMAQQVLINRNPWA